MQNLSDEQKKLSAEQIAAQFRALQTLICDSFGVSETEANFIIIGMITEQQKVIEQFTEARKL